MLGLMWWSTKSGTRYACPNISQNRKHREHPDGSWLTKPGIVPRTARSHDRLSTSSLTGAEAAQVDLLTTLPPTFVESQPTRLEVLKGFHKEGFEAVAQWLTKSQRYQNNYPPRTFTPPPPDGYPQPHSYPHAFRPLDIPLHIIFVYKILK